MASLNENYSVNSAKQPAAPGSVIQIYATGLSGTGVITAKIGSEVVTQPYYGGPGARDLPGLQQVDLILPTVPDRQLGECCRVRWTNGRAGSLQPGGCSRSFALGDSSTKDESALTLSIFHHRNPSPASLDPSE